MRSSHILAPGLLGFTYARTVATLPGAFFLVGCAAVFGSLLLLMGIRLRKEESAGSVVNTGPEESAQS